MARILNIISSPRGEQSNSIKLANAVIDRLREKEPASFVKVKDLTRNPFPHLEEVHLNAFLHQLRNTQMRIGQLYNIPIRRFRK
ncbi:MULTISPECIES: NAD(P)H-dependent oxidoreductase [Olivibacter]|uniref:NAD(P)H-dependent oxidoreductase n=1 Tax=Olivibacter jilunii TaxID=985016 RepID=A0ABW6B343_9SPHI